ncbi:MAG: hypothetical protein WA755_01430 [Candidatus Acidiferrales bacterium]
MITIRTSVLIVAAFAAALVVLVWRMRRMSLRGRFIALIALGVSVGVVVLTVTQASGFPAWLGTSLVAMLFVAAPFATRRVMQALEKEERDQEQSESAR